MSIGTSIFAIYKKARLTPATERRINLRHMAFNHCVEYKMETRLDCFIFKDGSGLCVPESNCDVPYVTIPHVAH